MRYCVYDPSFPVQFSSSGNLISEDGFMHPNRNIDTFVLIVVQKGVLHISQDGSEYHLGSNEFMLLFPNRPHFGTRPSEGPLSYYWAHFYITDPAVQISDTYEPPYVPLHSAEALSPTGDRIALAEHGTLPFPGHSRLLFLQLMDLARRERYQATCKCHYMTSLLLIEVSEEVLQLHNIKEQEIPPRLMECVDWIQRNYHKPLTLEKIAGRFAYNPAYLTSLFSAHMGESIIGYTNRVRISAAKIMLADHALTIKTIADQCGFKDTKYFYRVFKKYEQTTPGEYRKVIRYKKIVS